MVDLGEGGVSWCCAGRVVGEGGGMFWCVSEVIVSSWSYRSWDGVLLALLSGVVLVVFLC